MKKEEIRCIESFMSSDHRDAKIRTLLPFTSFDVAKKFYGTRRNLNDLLEFLRIENFKKKMHDMNLPLVLKNHIRHCVLNEYLKDNYVDIEPSCAFEDWFQELPPNLLYALRRICRNSKILHLGSGWSLIHRELGQQMENDYKENMPVDSIWSEARVISTCYQGLGHYKLLGYYPPSKSFFSVDEGGSNGWDRRYNFKKVHSMTNLNDCQTYERRTRILLENLVVM